MIKSIATSKDGTVVTGLRTEAFKEVLSHSDSFLWVDITGNLADDYESMLLDTFRFHPLAVDDALQETHVPKVDRWDTYLYLVLRTVRKESHGIFEIDTPELDIFLGENYLVTYHEGKIPIIVKIWELCNQDVRYLSRGVSYLLYQLADEIVNDIIAVIEDLDDRLDQIEDEIFTNPQPGTIEHIFTIKRVALRLRRTLIPQREVFNKLARSDFDLIPEHDQVYFRDVYDHMERLQEFNDGLRDLASGALDTYLSVVNNRMNETVKTLTIVTTFFMPLTFLTGFFGMNFFQSTIPLNAWTGSLAFMLVLTGMVLTPIIMYFWMRRRAWM